jgi:3-hydroxyacyl-[acyl-carrier-protein] dehydratase
LLSINDIMKIIPQRPPFLFVDSVEIVESMRKVIGKKCISINEPYFVGHFPKEPVMPGVLLIEAMAQTGAVALLSEAEFAGKNVYFAGAHNVKVRKKVIPGDILIIEVNIDMIRGSYGKGKASIRVRNDVVATAQLMFAVQD